MNKGSNLRKVFQKTFSEAYGSGGRMIDNDPRNHPDHGITVHSSGQFFKKHAHEDDYGIHQVTTDQDNTLGVRTKPYVVKTVVHDPREAPVIRDTLLRQGINPSILQSQIPSKPLRQNHPSDESHQAALSNYRKMWADKDKATGTLHDLIRQGRVGSYAYTAESKPEVHHPVNPRNFSSLRGLQRPTTHHGWAPIGEKAPDFSHLHARNNPRLPETHTAPDNEDVAANQAYMWASNPKTSSAYPNVSTSEQQEALLKMHQEAKDRAFRDLGLHHVQQNNPNLKLKVEDHAVGGELVKHHMKNMLENHPLFPKGWLRPLVDYKAGKGPRPTSQGSPNPNRAIESTTMSKSQRIRDIFESKLAELRNPTLTGRQRIGKEHLIKGKEAVQAAIKAGKKTGEPFSKTQLADIAQQHTDVPEIEAEEKGGGAKLPQHMRSSTPRAIATKKALLGDIKSRKQAEEDRFQGEVKAEIQRRNQPQNSSTNYARAGLRALFENNYLRLHPVGKPGDQAIHDTLRAHFDSLDPKIGADLHKQLDRHIKMYHYVRETPGESGAHAELRRFEHEHLRNMAETGSQGVTPNDVRQHFHMFNTDDPSDRLAHTAIKDSFYRPKESKSNIRAGLKALFETVLDEARGLGSQASKERQGKLERRFDKLDQVAREQRGTTVSRGGVTYIGNSPVTTRSQKKVSKERARVALKLEPPKDEPDPNPDPA